jgi:hypothetical protein
MTGVVGDARTECVYCGAELPGGEQHAPAVDDEAAWYVLAIDHADDCEWIATRGHRRPAPDDDNPPGRRAA